jgi:peroxiredoxin
MPVKSRFVDLGAEAPDFTLPTPAGQEVTLSDYRGDRNVVLIFLRGFL